MVIRGPIAGVDTTTKALIINPQVVIPMDATSRKLITQERFSGHGVHVPVLFCDDSYRVHHHVPVIGQFTGECLRYESQSTISQRYNLKIMQMILATYISEDLLTASNLE